MPSFEVSKAQLIPPHTINYHGYKQFWYRGPMVTMLREMYGNDRKAYFATYQPTKPRKRKYANLEKEAAATSRRHETRIMHQLWEAKGRSAMLECIARLLAAGSKPNSGLTNDILEDPVLVSIDFEMYRSHKDSSVKQFGVTTLDTREIYQARTHLPTLHSLDYILSKWCSRRKFLFGYSERTDDEHIRDIILKSLTIPDTLSNAERCRNVILVGHGIQTELRCMQDLNLSLDSLPMVVGILDTLKLGRDVLGRSGSLESLIDSLGIDLNRNRGGIADQLHCAGNDANYTMRVLLALLGIQVQNLSGTVSPAAVELSAILGEIARAGVPESPYYLTREDESDSDIELGDTFLEHN